MTNRMKFRLPVNWLLVAFILGLYGIGFLLYPYLPEMMPSHWNLHGQVDGYMPKTIYLLFFPSLILGVYLLLGLAPLIDPRPDSYEKFRGVFEGFRIIMVLLFAIIYLATVAFAMGMSVSIGKVVRFAIGLMLLFTGNYFGKVRHNYTFGIRTPWTLASEEVWNRTHRISGPLWVITGAVWLASVFLPERSAFVVCMAALVLVTLFAVVYSFVIFTRLQKQNKKD